MTPTFTATETIALPPGRVWDALTDWSIAPTWMRGVERVHANGPTAAGTVVTFHARGTEHTSTITGCEPGHRIVLRSVQGGVTADYTYELRAAGTGTEVSLVAECKSDGLGWKLASPLLRLAIKMTDGGQLRALKRAIEREQHVTAPT